MKKYFFVMIMFILLLGIAYKLFLYADSRKERNLIIRHKSYTRLNKTEHDALREGDIILRRGFGYFSDIIATRLNKGKYDVTHAGIIVKRSGNYFVIHSLSSAVSGFHGVQIQPLAEFLSYSMPETLIVTRLKNASPEMGKKVALFAEKYLAAKIPFDESGDYDDASAFFCTELVWHILEKDLRYLTLPKQPDARRSFFYAMAPMYDTGYFDIVVNQYR